MAGMLLTLVETFAFSAPGDVRLLTVHNKGVGGQSSRQGRARFEKNVVGLKPDYVFIYFGINDTLNEPAFLSVEDYIGNLKWTVADEITDHATIVCLGDSVTWGAVVKGSGTTLGETYPACLQRSRRRER